MNTHPRATDYPESMLDAPIPDESELTASVQIRAGKRYGFFTDTTLCIGCKACEAACKQWNALPADDLGLSGMSYDNTRQLSSYTWRHVQFIERLGSEDERPTTMPPYQSHWLMMSDVCKHCGNAPCLEACPTGAIFRTEFDTVVVQTDICNGCGYCQTACPFGVVEVNAIDGKAHKCTLCYDRLKGGFEPACAKACPTNSIQFGELDTLDARAQERVDALHAQGVTNAYLYGTPGAPGSDGGLERLNAFFLLTAEPETYNLPRAPSRPSNRVMPSLVRGAAAVAVLVAEAVAVLGDGKASA
jgi:formate dehydrogenase iron-sulfur subunit